MVMAATTAGGLNYRFGGNSVPVIARY